LLIIVGAEIFVGAVEHGAEVASLPVGLVALVLAPLATELPENYAAFLVGAVIVIA
jgi:cation:H+ antiporter